MHCTVQVRWANNEQVPVLSVQVHSMQCMPSLCAIAYISTACLSTVLLCEVLKALYSTLCRSCVVDQA